MLPVLILGPFVWLSSVTAQKQKERPARAGPSLSVVSSVRPEMLTAFPGHTWLEQQTPLSSAELGKNKPCAYSSSIIAPCRPQTVGPLQQFHNWVNEAYPHRCSQKLVPGDKTGYGRTGPVVEGYKPGAQAVRQQDRVPELSQDVQFPGRVGTVGCRSNKANYISRRRMPITTKFGAWQWQRWRGTTFSYFCPHITAVGMAVKDGGGHIDTALRRARYPGGAVVPVGPQRVFDKVFCLSIGIVKPYLNPGALRNIGNTYIAEYICWLFRLQWNEIEGSESPVYGCSGVWVTSVFKNGYRSCTVYRNLGLSLVYGINGVIGSRLCYYMSALSVVVVSHGDHGAAGLKPHRVIPACGDLCDIRPASDIALLVPVVSHCNYSAVGPKPHCVGPACGDLGDVRPAADTTLPVVVISHGDHGAVGPKQI